MAFSIKSGTLNVPGATGDQAITGVGFQPKAVLFYYTLQTSDGTAVDFQWGIGAMTATGTGNQWAVSANSADAAASSDNDSRTSNAACITYINASASTVLAATCVSLDSDGFTINWSVVTSGVDVHWVAFGGADLTNAKAGTFNKSITTTVPVAQSVTGVGFQPEAILFCTTRQAQDAGNTTGTRFGLGAAISSSSRWTNSYFGTGGSATMNTGYYQRTSLCLSILGTNAVEAEADFTSMDADGFSVSWSTNDASARRIHYLAFNGGQYALGSFNQATSTGNQATTGVGFTPTGLFLTSVNQASATTVGDNLRHSIGFGVSSSDRRSIWGGDRDNVADAIADHDSDTTKIIKMMTEGTPTTDAAADLVTLDSDGFTLNWTTADATARQILYMAFGSDAVAGVTVKKLAALGVG